jgi:F0F1-type ATP synthase assembly protein I
MAGKPGSLAGSAYQGAVESVFAIVIATGVGYWADSRFGTSPRWLIVGTLVGFGAFVLRLARMARLIEDPRAAGESDESEPTSEDESGTDDRERR